VRTVLTMLLVMLVAGCARGPEEANLPADVQARLDALFGRPVLVLQDLNRQGSAPFASADDGVGQVIVYFNARLEFKEAYDPSNWEGLNPQLIAAALGATDEGVVGLAGGRMEPGSELRAYGSLIYRRDGKNWQPAALRLAAAPDAAQSARVAPSRTDHLIRRLAQLTKVSIGSREQRERIVAEELDRALQNIQLRLDAGTQSIVVASGPPDGEYAQMMTSVVARLGEPRLLQLAYTEGSVVNATMVDSGRARFALVQSDVAQAAVRGEGLFAATGPMRQLRAVASLFPEPLHVLVRADSGIETMAQLAGRRISLGGPGSGTRSTALLVLAAHGLSEGAYTEVRPEGLAAGLQELADGTIDAFVEVVSAPWNSLARHSSGSAFRLLPLDPAMVENLVASRPALVPLMVPARTYPGQDKPIPTVAATALLVTSAATPEPVVQWMLDALFSASDVPGRGVSVSRLSRQRAQIGVSIPLHGGAAQYFGTTSGLP
jgi:TRAP transporter TAXI family solute receptor